MAPPLTQPADAPKLLIVDDQRRNLDVLEAMLADLDCVPVRALTADEALLAVVRNEFAAIVLDMKMPDMSGLELARLIKQRRRSRHVPILFLTAHMFDERTVLEGYGVGAVDYLMKPVTADVLRSKVGVFIELFKKTRELEALNEALQLQIAAREQAQAALEASNVELEQRVEERTAALEQAQRVLRENEERLRMALAVAGIAAWNWDVSSGRMTWSTDPEALLGFPPETFGEDRRLVTVVDPDDRDLVAAAAARALTDGGYHLEYRLVGPEGRVVWIAERGVLVTPRDSPSPRIVGVSRNITAEKSAAAERESLLETAQAAKEQAERQSRLKDEFLATLSHELRTPMNVILGWLSMVDGGAKGADPAFALSVIRRNAELQARLIDDLLDTNRLMSGSIKLAMESVDVLELLRGTVDGLSLAAQGKQLQLNAEAEFCSRRVIGDGKRLQQVLWNVIHNALKFTPSGGRVTVRLFGGPDSVQIEVRDTGRGIGPSFLPFIFDRFRQEQPFNRRSIGLGLGLAIAKELVELHGGTIAAESPGVGAGSVFTITLPSNPNAMALSSAATGASEGGGPT